MVMNRSAAGDAAARTPCGGDPVAAFHLLGPARAGEPVRAAALIAGSAPRRPAAAAARPALRRGASARPGSRPGACASTAPAPSSRSSARACAARRTARACDAPPPPSSAGTPAENDAGARGARRSCRRRSVVGVVGGGAGRRSAGPARAPRDPVGRGVRVSGRGSQHRHACHGEPPSRRHDRSAAGATAKPKKWTCRVGAGAPTVGAT